MGTTNKIDQSRMMGTSSFKKEINHLLYSDGHTSSDGELDPGWNCRDHALVMALLLKSGDNYPKIANGKCMFVQGPISGNPSLEIGQESGYSSGHNWVIHSKFGHIDVNPTLQLKHHRFSAPFNGVFNRVWLPPGKDRVSVVVCDSPADYESEIQKATHAMSHSTAVYLHLDDLEVSEEMIKSPFKFLNSRISNEIKKRFGPDFYIAVARHLHGYMLGKKNSLVGQARLKAWGSVVDG